MGPIEIEDIKAALKLTTRDLAKALNVDPFTVSRWERGQSTPVGLQEDVLQALHNVALEARKAGDEEQTRFLRGLILLGVGALIFYLLMRNQGRGS